MISSTQTQIFFLTKKLRAKKHPVRLPHSNLCRPFFYPEDDGSMFFPPISWYPSTRLHCVTFQNKCLNILQLFIHKPGNMYNK